MTGTALWLALSLAWSPRGDVGGDGGHARVQRSERGSHESEPIPVRDRRTQVAVPNQRWSGLLNVRRALAERLAASPNDALRLEGSLALLAGSTERDDDLLFPCAALRQLAGHGWLVRRDETVRDFLKRTADALNDADHPYLVRSREVHDLLRESGLDPYDWRQRQEFWLGLVETIIESKRSADPASIWTQQMAAAPAAELYRFAYLEVIRTSPGKPVSIELLRPLVAPADLSKVEELRRLMLVVSALEQAGVSEEEPDVLEVRRRFFQRLAETQCVDRDAEVLRDPLILLFRHSRPETRRRVVNALLEQRPAIVLLFSAVAGVPVRERWAWFLARPESLDSDGAPLGEVVVELADRVRLPLWIDQAIHSDRTPVRIKAQGTWLHVLEQVLAVSGHEVRFLEPDILWIGPARSRPAAEALVRRAKSRIDERGFLKQPIDFEFIDLPTRDALLHFADVLGIPLVLLSPDERLNEPLTGEIREVPAYLALELIGRQTALEWDTLEIVVLVGPPDRFDAIVAAREQHRRRMVEIERLKLDGNRLGAILSGSTDLEFVTHPLHMAAASLSESHNLSVAVAPLAAQDRPVKLKYSGEPLALALTVMLIEPGLTWATDGTLVLMGHSAIVKQFQERAAGRQERRGAYPPALADALQRPVDLELHDKAVQTVVEALEEKLGGRRIRLGGAARRLTDQRTSLSLKHVPLDAVLDVLSLQLDADWRIDQEGHVIIEPESPR